MPETDEDFSETLCSKLSDICLAAAARYEEHAEHLSKLGDGPHSAYGQMAQTFREQMVQARQLAAGFSERSSALAAVAAGAISVSGSVEEIMNLVEAYGDARVAARESSRDRWGDASSRTANAKTALQVAIEGLAASVKEPESDGYGYTLRGYRP